MATFNQWTGIGHVGKLTDVSLKVTPEGKPYYRFSLAVDQGKDAEPMWLNIICWQDLAERADQLLFTGAQIFVQGRLQLRKYKDKQKIERIAVEIVAVTLQLLDKKRPKEGDTLPDEVLPEA